MKKYLLIVLALLLQISVFAQSGFNLSSDEKDKIEMELKIYPNPVKNNKVTISFESKQIAEVHFISITGKEVLKQVYDFPSNQATIFLNDIPNGLYILQIKTTEDRVIAKKLMISRN